METVREQAAERFDRERAMANRVAVKLTRGASSFRLLAVSGNDVHVIQTGDGRRYELVIHEVAPNE